MLKININFFVDEYCSGICDYGCLQMGVELVNGDVVAKIPICELGKLSKYLWKFLNS